MGISAAAAAARAAPHAVLGVMLSDPEVTWAAVRRVLPPSLIYDVILSPFVLYAVVRLNGWAARAAPGESAAASAPASWAARAARDHRLLPSGRRARRAHPGCTWLITAAATPGSGPRGRPTAAASPARPAHAWLT